MSKSTTVATIAAFLGLLVFLLTGAKGAELSDLIWVATASFNVAAIIGIMVVFVRLEKSTNAVFGRAVRDNIGTIQVALVISLIVTVVTLVEEFGISLV